MDKHKENYGVVVAGLALFSMFFGAGNITWPMILGVRSGDMTIYTLAGLLIAGVSLPILGLLGILLFNGNYNAFFRRVGKVPSFILIFIVQAILGPVGSIPRIITMEHSIIQKYLPFEISLAYFSIIACVLTLFLALKKNRIIDILGKILTPVLLACILAIFIVGFSNPPEMAHSDLSRGDAFMSGIVGGYSTLDIIASFIFAPFVLWHFRNIEPKDEEPQEACVHVLRKMLKACAISGVLLASMFIGLIFLSAQYGNQLDSDMITNHPQLMLSAISTHLLGDVGGLIASTAILMACFTTAIPLVSIAADYIHKNFMKEKGSIIIPQVITLAISCLLANLGFMGIANMLNPVLQFIVPILIVLCIVNIYEKIYRHESSLPRISELSTEG